MKQTINGIEYTYNNNGIYIKLIDAKIPNGVTHLEISDIDGVPVTTIGYRFLCYNKTLTSISLPKVTTIGNGLLCYNETILINNGEIINADGIPVFVSNKKKLGELTVHYGAMNSRDGKETYVVSFGELHSHGTTISEAKEDLLFKIAQKDFNPEKVVAEIKETGMVTLTQYRLITGACRQGCANFLEQNNLVGTTQLPLEQALKLTGNAWGGERLKSLLN